MRTARDRPGWALISDLTWALIQVGGVLWVALGPELELWGWPAFETRVALFFAFFLLVELLGVALSFPFTWTVRSYLARAEPGLPGAFRVGLVFFWIGWMLVLWYGLPLPELVLGAVGLGFCLWIMGHMYAELRKAEERFT